MLDTIEKLREKPEAYRKRVAFVTAASIAGVIFLIWLSVLGVRFKDDSEIVSEEDKSSLFAEVQEGFSGIFEISKEQFEGAKKDLEGIFQEQ